MASYGAVQGQVRTTSACAISFAVSSSQMKTSVQGTSDARVEIALIVPPCSDCPDIAPGLWMIIFDVRVKSSVTYYDPYNKVLYFSGQGMITPPEGAIIQDQKHVDFIIMSQNFSMKGHGYMSSGQWHSRSDELRAKEITFKENKEKEESLSRRTWLNVICSSNKNIEVELIFHVERSDSQQTKRLLTFSSQLWNNRQLHTDCVLISRDGKQFPAHRFILASRSSVFAAMFEHDLEEKKTGTCEICDFDGSLVEILLEFLYTGQANTERIKAIVDTVYDTGDKYDVKDLCGACENIMVENLNANTALGYLNFAQTRGLDILKVRAIKYMNTNIGCKAFL